jgi:hypothetical protein
MTGSNVLPQACGMMLCVAAALSTLLATGSSAWPLWLWDDAPAGDAKPGWLPWLVLATFGLASGIAAVLYPLPSAAVFG